MSQNEKRALEIYISLIVQYIRKENNKALEHLKLFFYSFAFMQNYDPEILYRVCIENIEIIEKIPTHNEILMASKVKTELLSFNFRTFKPYYKRGLTKLQLRQKQFSEKHIMLLPKIKNEDFHKHLLTFLQDFAIMCKTIPIKGGTHAK